MPRRPILLLLLLGALFAAVVVQGLPQRTGPAYAVTFEVNSTNDNNDGFCNVTHCSFREAVIAANGTSARDLISFEIPGVGPHIIVMNEGAILSQGNADHVRADPRVVEAYLGA